MIAITVEDLHLTYKSMKAVSIRKTLFSLKKSEAELFEALRGVSFTVSRGDVIGVIGKNGSGKSTLLRVIAGIFSPNLGTVNVHDNSISLMSIGVGFQNKLSGRENIILSGLLIGFSEKEIREKMDEIIAFSELGKFIDKPVQTYSSGMYSKLAFSITAILESDILLIDEVLSVGDAKFKKKSLSKIKELILDADRTVLIVSHSMSIVEKMCNKALWLEDGKIKMFDTSDKVIAEYKASEGDID